MRNRPRIDESVIIPYEKLSPDASYRADGKLEEYGSGVSMFMNAVKLTEKIFKENEGAD